MAGQLPEGNASTLHWHQRSSTFINILYPFSLKYVSVLAKNDHRGFLLLQNSKIPFFMNRNCASHIPLHIAYQAVAETFWVFNLVRCAVFMHIVQLFSASHKLHFSPFYWVNWTFVSSESFRYECQLSNAIGLTPFGCLELKL